jgi:hypothetical protein
MLASLHHRSRYFTAQRVTWCAGSFKQNAVSPQDGAAREPWQRYREALNPVLASHASLPVDLLVKLCCNRSSATLGPCLCFLPGALFRRWRWTVLLHAALATSLIAVLFCHFCVCTSFQLKQALSIGLADMLAADGESAAAAALRHLRPIDPRVMLAAKRAVNAMTTVQETRVFEGVWGKAAHAESFSAVLRKSK